MVLRILAVSVGFFLAGVLFPTRVWAQPAAAPQPAEIVKIKPVKGATKLKVGIKLPDPAATVVKAKPRKPTGSATQPGTGDAPPAGARITVVFPLGYAKAPDLPKLLRDVYPELKVIAVDARTNSLVIRADSELLEEVGSVIESLDVET
jgi:type II secretory pathway component GspD/PulD (secretin)